MRCINSHIRRGSWYTPVRRESWYTWQPFLEAPHTLDHLFINHLIIISKAWDYALFCRSVWQNVLTGAPKSEKCINSPLRIPSPTHKNWTCIHDMINDWSIVQYHKQQITCPFVILCRNLLQLLFEFGNIAKVPAKSYFSVCPFWVPSSNFYYEMLQQYTMHREECISGKRKINITN